MKKRTVTITISGKSAQDLSAVGAEDLKEYFLPTYLKVKPWDVESIVFTEDEEEQ